MKRLLLVALMVLVTLIGMVGVSREAESQNDTPTMSEINNAVSALQATANPTTGAVSALQATVNDGVQVKSKVYYLTKNTFTRGDAITACDCGFHVASISEILDPSNLQYATRSTPAYNAPPYDPGFGPPSDYMMGWVRTGSFPIEGVPDYRDCSSMSSFDHSMSGSDHQRGTTLALHTKLWGDPYNYLYPSYTETESQKFSNNNYFSHPQPVWCVEDPE